jgi:hypothetical protein
VAVSSLRCCFKVHLWTDAPADIRELPHVDIEYEDSDRLSALIAKAESLWEHTTANSIVVFGGAREYDGVLPSNGLPVAVVGRDGKLEWPSYSDYEYTIGSVKLAHEDGIFRGNPEILVWELPHGNGGVSATWSELIHFLTVLGGVHGGIQAIRATLRIARSAFERLQASPDQAAEARWLSAFFKHHSVKWEEQEASVEGFLATVLRPKQWDSSVLRRRLEIGPEEADRFLKALGYDYKPSSRLYELGDDRARLELRRSVVEQHIGHDPATWEDDIRSEG